PAGGRVMEPDDALATGPLRRAWTARRFLTDWSVVALAGAVAAGALRPIEVPVAVPVVLVAAAAAARRPVLVVPAAALLAAALASQAIEGAAPAAAGSLSGEAVLVTDPEDSFGAARALVRTAGHRYELRARG